MNLDHQNSSYKANSSTYNEGDLQCMCASVSPTVPYNVGLNSGPPQVGGAVQPPPYSVGGSSGGQTMFVQCRVCQHVIHVGSGSQTRVVKCGNCREATVRLLLCHNRIARNFCGPKLLRIAVKKTSANNIFAFNC